MTGKGGAGVMVPVPPPAPVQVTAGVSVPVPPVGPSRFGINAVQGVNGPAFRVLPEPVNPGWTQYGVTFSDQTCGDAQPVSALCGAVTDIDPGSTVFTRETVDGHPAGVRAVVDCSPFAMLDADGFKAAATAAVDAMRWRAVAAELWSGTVHKIDGVSSGWLSDGTAIDVTTALPESNAALPTVLTLPEALQALAVMSGQCSTGGERVIHGGLGFLEAALQQVSIVPGEAPGRWRTASGMIVVGDAGYGAVGFDPARDANVSPNAVRVYLTSQINIVLTPVLTPDQLAGSIERNQIITPANIGFAFGWFCCHYTALVDLCKGCC